MVIISAKTCSWCENDTNFQEVGQCSYCGNKDEEPAYYCLRKCHKANCRTTNCPDHVSCWDAHLPHNDKLRAKHRKVDQLPQIYVNTVTYSEPDAAVQRSLHQDDRIAQWFVVKIGSCREDNASLCVFDRFRRLCNPGISGSRWSSNAFPSFVSFIGDTGTGKSTLVRAMILMGQVNASKMPPSRSGSPDDSVVNGLEDFIDLKITGPVTRTANIEHLTDPTSTGVHLYKDVTTSSRDRTPQSSQSRDHANPLLFADCEGFGSGTTMNNADRGEDVNTYLLFERPITSPSYGTRGKEGAELFYARFLYAFSDVVVFVTNDDQRLEEYMQRLLEWAASAVNKSVNHLAQKTLVVVRNMTNRHTNKLYDEDVLKHSIFDNLGPLWKSSEQLKRFRDAYNRSNTFSQRGIHSNRDFFAVFFQKIDFCYIPDKDKAPTDEIFKQYQRLRKQIVRASEAGQEVRSKSWTQYNIPTLSHLLLRAFEHFRISDTPFDFYQAARKDNPNPASISDHISNLLRHLQLSKIKEPEIFAKVVSICMVSYALRNFEQAWEPEDIFEKDLRPHCEMAIQKYCEKFQNCAFRFSSGLECIVRRPGHDKHCAENGTRIPGQFDPSEYQEDSTKTVNEIRRLFIALYKNLCARDQQVPSLPNPEIIFKQREEVFESFVSTWKLTKSNKTCFTCLQSVPDHVLPCGHGYCPVCVQEFGQKSNYFEYGLEMDHCILCQTQWRERHVQLIRLKPKCAGFRILTLDGGGVRGIMELALLDALERRIGLRLPIREFFDLIMGTSTGGIIALGLAVTNHTAANMRERFTELATATFKHRREGKLSDFDPLRITSKFLMLLRITDSIYPTTPLRDGLKRLFGEDLNLYSSARIQQQQRLTRVAVTSTKDTAATRCLITNYNRLNFSSGDDFEREDDDSKEMKVWEAGLATAAAPFYFRPFEKEETSKDYVDGALHANLPIQYALEELANLWPKSDCDTSLDILVSVGTGIQQKENFLPTLLKIGGFQQIFRSFQANINTERLWRQMINNFSYATETRNRIQRLNAEIEGDYVALDNYQKMKAMEDMVDRQTDQIGDKPSPLAMRVAKVADMLIASLFFFEPDISSFADGNFGDPTAARKYELNGSIRCRLKKNSPELKRLLNIRGGVDGFWQQEVEKSAFSATSLSINDNCGYTRIPFSVNERNRIVTGNAWFRVNCIISTQEPIDMQQVIAITLASTGGEEKAGLREKIPISGFPISFRDLQKKAKMVRSVALRSGI